MFSEAAPARHTHGGLRHRPHDASSLSCVTRMPQERLRLVATATTGITRLTDSSQNPDNKRRVLDCCWADGGCLMADIQNKHVLSNIRSAKTRIKIENQSNLSASVKFVAWKAAAYFGNCAPLLRLLCGWYSGACDDCVSAIKSWLIDWKQCRQHYIFGPSSSPHSSQPRQRYDCYGVFMFLHDLHHC